MHPKKKPKMEKTLPTSSDIPKCLSTLVMSNKQKQKA